VRRRADPESIFETMTDKPQPPSSLPPSGIRAVEAAVEALYNCGSDDPGPEIQDLLVNLLASAIITPPDHAGSRARQVAELLIAIVDESISQETP